MSIRKTVIILFVLLAVCGAAYLLVFPMDVEGTEEEKFVQQGDNALGNMVFFAEETSPGPGGVMKYVRIPEGSARTIKMLPVPLMGFSAPAVGNGCLFYDVTWDGSGQGFLRCMKDSIRIGKRVGYVYNDCWGFTPNAFYYLGKYNHLIRKARRDGAEKSLVRTPVEYFTGTVNELFYYDKRNGRIGRYTLDTECTSEMPFPDKGSACDMLALDDDTVLVQTTQKGIWLCDFHESKVSRVVDNPGVDLTYTRQIWVHDDELYYSDSSKNYFVRPLEGGEQHLMIHSKALNFMGLRQSVFENGSFYTSWCDDYIVVEEAFYDYDKGTTHHGMVAFDYQGKKVMEKCID